MPWKETCTVDQREMFARAWLSQEFKMSELCERFAVSRPTGYKWVQRFCAEGTQGLADRSRAPKQHPNATPADQVAAILALKRKHLSWGPVTLRDWLRREHPQSGWPAASTIGELLKTRGLVESRHRRHPHTPPYTQPFAAATQPNASWSADFKGQFALGDLRICYPLTITDNHSRFLLCCQGLYRPTTQSTRAHYERTFREYGLPQVLRTDNGPPFAGVALGGLSTLAIWLLKLGVLPERIEPGKPQQNGRHERMHRTLKAATVVPPKANLSAQQRAFNRFREEYNQERPHRALGGGQRPAEVFRPSSRCFPERLPEVVYPDTFTIRKVRANGSMKWNGNYVYVGKILAGEHVGLKPFAHERWEIFFAQLPLGVFDERTSAILRP